jgi:transcriptional regulator with XRE-family HTH domain
MSIHTRIRKLREAKGLKQQTMADLLDMSQAAYNKIENAQTSIKVDILVKIAEILQISLDELVKGECYTNIQLNNKHANINNQPTFMTDTTELKALYERLLEAEKRIAALKDEKIQDLEKELLKTD